MLSNYQTKVEQLPIITTKPNTFRIPEDHNVVLPCDVDGLGQYIRISDREKDFYLFVYL